MLHVQNIEKYYGSKNNVTKALDRISFDVQDGEFIAIMGASGSGKTTLLNCISTIDTVSAGSILLDGQDIAQLKPRELAKFRRERLGFVFQDFNLLDTLTLEENIGLALTINHTDGQSVQSRVQAVAQRLGIEDVLGKFPYQVSGRAEAASRLRPSHGGRAVAHSGRRTHRSLGLQGVENPFGDHGPDEPGDGRDHRHGHPRRLQRQLCL